MEWVNKRMCLNEVVRNLLTPRVSPERSLIEKEVLINTVEEQKELTASYSHIYNSCMERTHIPKGKFHAG